MSLNFKQLRQTKMEGMLLRSKTWFMRLQPSIQLFQAQVVHRVQVFSDSLTVPTLITDILGQEAIHQASLIQFISFLIPQLSKRRASKKAREQPQNYLKRTQNVRSLLGSNLNLTRPKINRTRIISHQSSNSSRFSSRTSLTKSKIR
jgi:hypothetical protein